MLQVWLISLKGEEMTREEIMKIIAPPKEEHDAVKNWFEARGNDFILDVL